MAERKNVHKIRRMKGREKIVAITAYDTPTARLVDQAEVDLILVGVMPLVEIQVVQFSTAFNQSQRGLLQVFHRRYQLVTPRYGCNGSS